MAKLRAILASARQTLGSNPGLLFVFLVAIAYSLALHPPTPVSEGLSVGQILFVDVYSVMLTIVWAPGLIFLVLASLLVQVFLGVWVSIELYAAHQGRPSGYFRNLFSIRLAQLVWCAVSMLIFYAAFGLLGLSLYLPLRALWLASFTVATPMLVVLFVMLYPLFYLSLSVSANLAAFPLSTGERIQAMLHLARPRSLRLLYLFYGVRLSLEVLLVFLLPIAAWRFFGSTFLAFVSVAGGLLIPFAFLRTSSYRLKIELLMPVRFVGRLFPEASSPSRDSLSAEQGQSESCAAIAGRGGSGL